MEEYSDKLLFEEAEIVKNKIRVLEKFKGKSTIVNPRINQVMFLVCWMKRTMPI